MRKLIVTTFVTLDGVMQAPGGPEEDTSGGFTHGGWTVPHFDEKVGAFMDATMGVPFDLVLGRRTYDIFASYWPNASEEEGAAPLNAATKYVASRGTPDLSWERSVLLEPDAVTAIRALKQEEGRELQVHGSSDLIQTLVTTDLVDEYRVLVFPVLVGRGKRLYGDGTAPQGLRLLDSQVSGTGVVMSRYATEGEARTGTFGG
ncbi:dihydrofolate reductase family protein [Cellulomonas aerilata]|uniref:Dihydrofolate reductase n=1 Tax=Cellulomonas aerilata TaxID=515326 RepID=A0A512D9K4_9CELL|nr:dihydrofolate reductase family protein [Cellulomonas aerilata]GEO33131.1 dihydrofolate reductase [Cellulomonas aerilata]